MKEPKTEKQIRQEAIDVFYRLRKYKNRYRMYDSDGNRVFSADSLDDLREAWVKHGP